MEKNIKVKLITDLTKYANGLTPGTEGFTVGRQGTWSKGNDHFITVHFPGITTIDVLWKSLEILDGELIREIQKQESILEEQLKTAQDVKLYLGSYGGFKTLSYTYFDKELGINCHISIGTRKKAYHLLEIFQSYNIPIKEIKK